MGYYEQNLLAQDEDFLARCRSCYAILTIPKGPADSLSQPEAWVNMYRYHIAASPGFADAYTYALSTGVENPGRNPAVITDEQILASVDALVNPTEEPIPMQEAK